MSHTTPQAGVSPHTFTQRFSSTPRGARLARHLVVQQLDAWGVPYGSGVSYAVAAIVGELAANAVTHGCVPGRDFEVRLDLRAAGTVRVAVSDTRTDRRPPAPDAVSDPAPLADRGRGLPLVTALAARWTVE